MAWVAETAAGSDSAPGDAVEVWATSWDVPEADGRSTRETTYAELTARFADELGRGGVAEQADLLFEGIRRARALPEVGLPDRIRSGILEAEQAHALAARALRSDDTDDALVHVLRGSDALREVGPEAVARTLVAEVETARRRVSTADAYTEQDIERIERLVQGARLAIEEGDWVRAIRRAFYANGLLAGGDR